MSQAINQESKIRQDQLEYARQQSDDGAALSRKSVHGGGGSKSEQKRISVLKGNPSRVHQQPKPKKTERKIEGHEVDFKKAVSSRAIVSVFMKGVDSMSGEIRGRIEKFDKYAIKIDMGAGESMWVFKSAIGAFKMSGVS